MAISIPSGQARLHRSAPPAPRIVDDGRPPTDYSSGQIQNMMSRKRTEIEELTKRRERSHAAIQAANTGPLSSFSSMLGCTAMPTCDADGVQVNEEVRRRADRRLAVVSPSRRAPRARVALEPQEMLDKHTSELGKKKKELKELERLHKTQRDWESDNPGAAACMCLM